MNCDSTDQANPDEFSHGPRYNVRVFLPDREMRPWCRDRGYPVHLSLAHDGDKVCGFIFSFTTVGHAMHFMTRFGISHDQMRIDESLAANIPSALPSNRPH